MLAGKIDTPRYNILKSDNSPVTQTKRTSKNDALLVKVKTP